MAEQTLHFNLKGENKMEYKTKKEYDRVIKQSMQDLNQVCLKHTHLTWRRIYNWLKREGDILEDEIQYLTNPIDAYEIAYCVSWERIGTDYTPHLPKWDQGQFIKDVRRVTEPGREAMNRRLDLDDPELMKKHLAQMER